MSEIETVVGRRKGAKPSAAAPVPKPDPALDAGELSRRSTDYLQGARAALSDGWQADTRPGQSVLNQLLQPKGPQVQHRDAVAKWSPELQMSLALGRVPDPRQIALDGFTAAQQGNTSVGESLARFPGLAVPLRDRLIEATRAPFNGQAADINDAKGLQALRAALDAGFAKHNQPAKGGQPFNLEQFLGKHRPGTPTTLPAAETLSPMARRQGVR